MAKTPKFLLALIICTSAISARANSIYHLAQGTSIVVPGGNQDFPNIIFHFFNSQGQSVSGSGGDDDSGLGVASSCGSGCSLASVLSQTLCKGCFLAGEVSPFGGGFNGFLNFSATSLQFSIHHDLLTVFGGALTNASLTPCNPMEAGCGDIPGAPTYLVNGKGTYVAHFTLDRSSGEPLWFFHDMKITAVPQTGDISSFRKWPSYLLPSFAEGTTATHSRVKLAVPSRKAPLDAPRPVNCVPSSEV